MKHVGIKAGVLVVMLLLIGVTATATPPKPFKNPYIVPRPDFPDTSFQKIPDDRPMFVPDWNNRWIYGDDPYSEGNRVTVDSNGDVIACGMDNERQGVLIKYERETGDLVWFEQPTEVSLAEPIDLSHLLPISTLAADEPIDIEELGLGGIKEGFTLWDVTVDSEDNVIAVGHVTNYNLLEDNIIVVVKHDGTTGQQIWNKTFSFSEIAFELSCGVAVGPNDNIYVCGAILHLDFPVVALDPFVLKLGSLFGATHWGHVDDIGLTIYNDLKVGSDGNPVVVGYKIEPPNDADGYYINKRSKFTGDIIDDEFIDNDARVYAMNMDTDDCIYVVGPRDTPDGSILVKFNPDFSHVYTTWVPGESFQDVDFLEEDKLVVASKRLENHYTVTRFIKDDGERIDKYKVAPVHDSHDEGHNVWVETAIGVATDGESIVVNGGFGAIDTIRGSIQMVDIINEDISL